MKKRARWIGAAALAAMGMCGAMAWPSGSEATDPPTVEALARDAVSEDSAVAESAIAALRSRGAEGHAALMRTHAAAIDALREGERSEDGERLRHAIDRVSGQRDGHASGLYWHTDLAAARRASDRSGRPVLSLRLLGRLDEELSCANSRFFRIVLYSDPRVAERLREGFVLHWSSERPAPRIEIDMGDGRRMVRTITGNSVHYLLDAEGRPVDAIVGLYGPRQFLDALARASHTEQACRDASDRARCLAVQHGAAQNEMARRWEEARRGEPERPAFSEVLASMPDAPPSGPAPSAVRAMPLTIAKAFVETSMLQGLRRGPPTTEELQAPPEPDWRALVQGDRVALSERTRALLRLKNAGDDLERLAPTLLETARADGARNEVLFRRRIHDWFSTREISGMGFDGLNARVYAELLLTPAGDPWLGLRGEDLYDGLEVAAD